MLDSRSPDIIIHNYYITLYYIILYYIILYHIILYVDGIDIAILCNIDAAESASKRSTASMSLDSRIFLFFLFFVRFFIVFFIFMRFLIVTPQSYG